MYDMDKSNLMLSDSKSAEELLSYCIKSGKIRLEDVLKNMEDMKNQDILKQHPYAITKGSNGRWYTYLPDKTKSSGRRQIAKSTEEKVQQAVISYYRKKETEESTGNLNLENLFEQWLLWRRDTGTDPKTIKENKNDWDRFLSKHPVIKKKVVSIEMSDMETFFLDITANHAITYKRLINVKSVLNGVFKHGIRLKIIGHSPMAELDYKQFRTRCKPPASSKENYTEEERQKILGYLSSKTDVYSLSIQLAFFLCLRIGELICIEKQDIQGDKIFIRRSTRKRQDMNDDLSFGKVHYDIEERIKGNQKEGFRFIPLTPQAQKIIQKTMELYPEGKYLFMRNGKPILADTFNRHLKSVCNTLDIPYRSSHQIRFTMATMFYEGGIKVNQLSTFLGHSDTKTTFHYIRQQKATEKTAELMTDILDV